MSRRSIRVQPVAGALGAELAGVELDADLCDETVAEIRTALLEHLVVFFRDQELTPSQFLAFAHRLGDPVPYPFLSGLECHPEITEVIKKENETVVFGGVWHSDGSYQETPPMATLLYALELPPVGGDTLFANQILAYETLSPGMRRLLDGLQVLQSAHQPAVSATRAPRQQEHPSSGGATRTEFEHPVVRVHPETGRRALFVNPAHSVRFADMTEGESGGLLETLFRHQTRPELTCRLRWQPGSLAIWDNRSTLHLPLNDYPGHRRVMHRITLAGDRPRGPDRRA